MRISTTAMALDYAHIAVWRPVSGSSHKSPPRAFSSSGVTKIFTAGLLVSMQIKLAEIRCFTSQQLLPGGVNFRTRRSNVGRFSEWAVELVTFVVFEHCGELYLFKLRLDLLLRRCLMMSAIHQY